MIYLFCSYIRVYFKFIDFVREHIWHLALFMGYSMRLELTRVCSLNDFLLIYKEAILSFSLSTFYLSLLYPSLIFDMFLSLCVCVYVCVCWCGFWFHSQLFFPCVSVTGCLRDFLSVSVVENYSNYKHEWVQVSLSIPLPRPCAIYVLWWKQPDRNIHVCKNKTNKQILKNTKFLPGPTYFDIYIYIGRERERKRELKIPYLSLIFSACI